MKKWAALGRAVAVGAIVLCSAAVRGEPADQCAVPGYLLFGDSQLDRVRAAVVNAGGSFPQRRITIGLSPAAMPKQGSGFDLALAAGSADR